MTTWATQQRKAKIQRALEEVRAQQRQERRGLDDGYFGPETWLRTERAEAQRAAENRRRIKSAIAQAHLSDLARSRAPKRPSTPKRSPAPSSAQYVKRLDKTLGRAGLDATSRVEIRAWLSGPRKRMPATYSGSTTGSSYE